MPPASYPMPLRDPISLFADFEHGRVLDVPGGEGRESAELRRLGFDVISADLFPRSAAGSAVTSVAADVNLPLPFKNSSFDYVLSREGIEHLESQAGFIRECARVLRLGGKIVITTPNVLNLSSRVSQLLTAQRKIGRGLANEVQTLRGRARDHYYHGHIFLIDYFRLRYLLRLAAFDRLEVATDKYSPTSIGLSFIVPAMWAASRWSIFRAKRKSRKKGGRDAPPEVLSEIMNHTFSAPLLYGKRMIVIADRIRGMEGQ